MRALTMARLDLFASRIGPICFQATRIVTTAFPGKFIQATEAYCG
jgi:hypothetical protein